MKIELKFQKYPSLINHYKISDIEYWLDKHPELKTTSYLLTEKIHGANAQIVVKRGKFLKFGKRNSFIDNNSKNSEDNFYNFHEAIDNNKNYKNLIKKLEQISLENDSEIVVYAELYGTGIQKEIYYGPNKYIKFYDIKENNEFWSAKKTMELLTLFDIFVPVIDIVFGFNNAISYNNIFISKLTPEDWEGDKDKNYAEGFVMKPYEFDLQNIEGSRFVIKSKNPKFSDSKEKSKKEFKQLEGNLLELLENAKSYINQNRLNDLCSKLGPLTDNKQIGEYMKAFIEDWEKDFKEDYKDELNDVLFKYNKNDIKDIFKIANKNAINLIKNHIEKYNEEAKEKLFS